MKLAAIALAFLLSTQIAYSIELKKEEKEAVTSVFSSLQSYFARIKTISFESTVTRWQNDRFLNKSFLEGPQSGFFNFLLVDGNFRIEDNFDMGPEGNQTRSLMAFDGESYQRLHYSRGMLYLKSYGKEAQERPGAIFLDYTNHFFQLFEFLSEALYHDEVEEFHLAKLADLNTYELLGNRILSVELPDGAKGDVFVEFSGGRDLMSGIPTFYRVQFSAENNYLPTHWQRLDSNRMVVVDYLVKGFKSVTDSSGYKFFVPEHIVMSGFVNKKVIPFEEGPVFTFDIHFPNTQINFSEVEEDAFTIDPTRARYILDSDSGVRITVPR